MSIELKKRLKSFAWRTGMMVLAVIIDQITQSLTSFNLPSYAVITAGLILGEISKALSNEIQARKESEF